uniref:DUF3122 domain-containing protein n=1 Tax=Cyanothece sp. (strain PCC 7425 / ATCC 29141) TaxID=395961 RepID=B8HU59_CYAP4
MLSCRIRKFFSWLLLLGTLVLAVFLALGGWDSSAGAAVQSLEEAPGQVVYQVRQTLPDQQGHRWQTIAFKRIHPDGQTRMELRLVGFPDTLAIAHGQPLTITNSLGTTLRARDTSSSIFTEAANPVANVAQYDLQPLLSQLQPEIPWQFSLPSFAGQPIVLGIPSELLQEWQTLAQATN